MNRNEVGRTATPLSDNHWRQLPHDSPLSHDPFWLWSLRRRLPSLLDVEENESEGQNECSDCRDHYEKPDNDEASKERELDIG